MQERKRSRRDGICTGKNGAAWNERKDCNLHAEGETVV